MYCFAIKICFFEIFFQHHMSSVGVGIRMAKDVPRDGLRAFSIVVAATPAGGAACSAAGLRQAI